MLKPAAALTECEVLGGSLLVKDAKVGVQLGGSWSILSEQDFSLRC